MRTKCRLLLIGLALATGCHSVGGTASLPTYTTVDAQSAKTILNNRAQSIHTFSAQCQLTLDKGDGQTIRLDGVFVMAPPDRVRLRAWKFGQAVFDLTLTPDGLWIETPPEAAKHGDIIPATLHAAQISRQLTWFTGGFFSSPDLKTNPTGKLIFSRDLPDGMTAVCDVDPATVTPRKFRLQDSTGTTRFTLDLTDYRNFNGIIWPTHLSAVELPAPGKKAGHIEISFEDIEFNSDLADQAFVPPPSAKRQP
jgi:hypothetical protein